MRYLCAVILPALFVVLALPARAQSPNPSSFLLQAQAASLSGRMATTLQFAGTAEWVAGSQHETGMSTVSASTDGSSSLQLSLGTASRTETQSKSDDLKACQWLDAAAKTHDVSTANCWVAVPWFAPILFTQPTAQLPPLLLVSDDGELTTADGTFHQITYRLALQGGDAASTKRLQDASSVKVLFDSQTFLPSSLEYSVHPDNNDLQSIPVKVVFSDYRQSAGAMLPFHIEKYVQRTIQLTLNVSNATVE